MEGTRILLVDDEPEFVQALAERMEARGLRVDTAASGEQALEKARQKTFDAILLDLAMPGLDGIETLKALLQINPDLQVILLTGQATMQKAIDAMKLGAVDFMEKPAEFKNLLARIDEASTKTMQLMEKRTEEKLAKILRKKGW